MEMMILVLMLISSVWLQPAFPNFCPYYMCTDKFESKEVCAIANYTGRRVNISLRECGKDSVCDILPSNLKETTCSPYYVRTKFYPGEYCRNDTECYSGVCQNNKCEGRELNEECTKDLECNPGLYCLIEQGRCVEAIKANSPYKENEKCAANLVKNETHCIKIGSIKNNKPSNVHSACRSLFADEGICLEGPTLDERHKNKIDVIRCYYDYEVNGTAKKIFMDPVCGMGKEAGGYCNPGIGDVKSHHVTFLNNN